MSVEGPVVETHVDVAVKPTKEEIRAANKLSMEQFLANLKDPLAKMGKDDYIALVQQEMIEKPAEFEAKQPKDRYGKKIPKNEFDAIEEGLLAQLRALSLVPSVMPTAPTKPAAQGWGTTFGLAKPDESIAQAQAAYAKEYEAYQAQKKDFDTHELAHRTYQQSKPAAKNSMEKVLAKQKVVLDKWATTVHPETPLGIKQAASLLPKEAKADPAPKIWKSQTGVVSQFHAQSRAQKNEFQQPIINAYRTLKKEQEDAFNRAQRARLEYLRTEIRPEAVEVEMAEAKERSRIAKLTK